jgi:hypothetical protein
MSIGLQKHNLKTAVDTVLLMRKKRFESIAQPMNSLKKVHQKDKIYMIKSKS